MALTLALTLTLTLALSVMGGDLFAPVLHEP